MVRLRRSAQGVVVVVTAVGVKVVGDVSTRQAAVDSESPRYLTHTITTPRREGCRPCAVISLQILPPRKDLLLICFIH